MKNKSTKVKTKFNIALGKRIKLALDRANKKPENLINYLKTKDIKKDKTDISRWVNGWTRPDAVILDEIVNFTRCDSGWLLSGNQGITADSGSYGVQGQAADLLKPSDTQNPPNGVSDEDDSKPMDVYEGKTSPEAKMYNNLHETMNMGFVDLRKRLDKLEGEMAELKAAKPGKQSRRGKA